MADHDIGTGRIQRLIAQVTKPLADRSFEKGDTQFNCDFGDRYPATSSPGARPVSGQLASREPTKAVGRSLQSICRLLPREPVSIATSMRRMRDNRDCGLTTQSVRTVSFGYGGFGRPQLFLVRVGTPSDRHNAADW